MKTKKLLILVILFTGVTFGGSAQTKVHNAKVKKTSTIPRKIHNTFSKHKKYSGTKSKVKVDKPTS